MTRLSAAFVKPHPAFFCFVTAGGGDTANRPGAPLSLGADPIGDRSPLDSQG